VTESVNHHTFPQKEAITIGRNASRRDPHRPLIMTPAPSPVPSLAEVERLQADLAAARAALSAANADNTRLRRDNRRLTDQVADLSARERGLGVYADPVQQLRHEIWTGWLHALTEHDRDRYPLAGYTLGPDLLPSVQALNDADRARAVQALTDTACGLVWDLPSRNPHRQKPPAAEPVVRADGATAWRCYIQQNTPSARRLVWWRYPDGRIEFAKIALHDDMACR